MITEDSHGPLISWNSSSDFCDWSGVSCGKRHRRVIAIRLQSQGLQGSLSPHVGNMSFLRVLSLGNNSFQGTIPCELGRLSRLRILALSWNKFKGVIPTNLSGCSNLKKLWLNKNNLVGSIPMEISFLSTLTELVFHENQLTGGIPPFLANLSSIEILSLTRNPLGGSIPHTLGRWKRIKEFYLGVCNLNGTIPASIYNFSLLTKFGLDFNQLVGSLSPTFGSMVPNLIQLQMGTNQLSGLLPSSISNCSKLHTLSMSENYFSGKVTIDFANLKDIVYINLSKNNFSGPRKYNALEFIGSLTNCSSLKTLSLSQCKLQGVVPTSIGNLSHQLSSLFLAGNQLYGILPSSIGNLGSLTYLALGANRFTSKIPPTIGMLKKLQFASLYGNQFSGQIPNAIGNLSLLNVLYLDSNNLGGYIPSSLGNCRNLLELYLSDNKLSGNIPEQLLQLSSLSVKLDLSHNNLSGSLSAEVGNLKTLSILDLSNNDLSGNIPSSLGDCDSLLQLSLRSNLFQGMIPASLSSLKGLEELDVSKNNLSGPIPPFLERLALQLLNISNNNFEGKVPVQGVFSNASAFSILGNNKLCGGLVELALPKCKETHKHKKRFSLFVVFILIISTLLFGSCFVYVWFKKKSKAQQHQSLTTEQFCRVSYHQLFKGTDGFSETNLIGKGEFSSVYKGTLDQYDNLVAIKVLHLQIRGAHRSFVAECEAWRSIRHRNLLKILTSCSGIDIQGNDFKALVYEFMPNGSLHECLHSNANTSRLGLIQRISILIDVASALDYLHNQCSTTIVHGDIKPRNILLDNDMVAHVGDFGLVKFLKASSNQNSSTGVRGTIGYAPPEYGLGSEMTSSGDVYSFGILLLEVMIGKKPIDDIFNESHSLHKFAHVALQGHISDIIDDDAIVVQSTQAKAQKIEECLASIVKVGVTCSMESPSQRMNINSVVHELLHIRDVLQNI
uniref:putative receptor-like protein kinase At3g47110 n=1 Tax=Erigeron canadensis TaxID=72917 RepID=UPI001CB952DE|nr:putative receptor-like protein kinase At3g47110 [Erigeron canadensis]